MNLKKLISVEVSWPVSTFIRGGSNFFDFASIRYSDDLPCKRVSSIVSGQIAIARTTKGNIL